MGQLLNLAAAAAATNSLNRMFQQNLTNTRNAVNGLRTFFPELLTATNFPPKRKEALRFAAFLLNDQISFTTKDPVEHNPNQPEKSFRKWLKWLTWIDLQDAPGWVDGNNAALPSPPGLLIRKTIANALANSVPIQFTWNEQSTGSPVLDIDTSNNALWKITMLSISVKNVNNSDSQEDDNP